MSKFWSRRGLSLPLLAICLSNTALADEAPAPVRVTQLQLQPLVEVVPISGTITAPQTSLLSAAVEGRVASMQVEIGDRVTSGTVLAELDSELAELRLNSARAEANETEASLADARRRLEDARELAKRQNIARNQVLELQAEVEMETAALERLRADMAYQQALLDRHRVTAPFAGVVSRKATEVGEWVTPGTAVVELTSADTLLLDFQVPQDYFARIDQDTPLQVALGNAANRPLSPAQIRAIVPVSDPNSRSFLLRAQLLDGEHAATPGMSVRGQLLLGRGEGIALPRDALVRHPDGSQSVWVVEREEGAPRAFERTVSVGISFDGKLEIKEGLQAQETVIVRGNESLEAGQPVRILDEAPDSTPPDQE